MNIFSKLAAQDYIFNNSRPAHTFFTWCDTSTCSLTDLIILIFEWLAVGVGIIVIIFVVVGAIQYITAAGNQDQAKKAIERIRNAVLALILYAIMWALINFLVPGGVFTS